LSKSMQIIWKSKNTYVFNLHHWFKALRKAKGTSSGTSRSPMMSLLLPLGNLNLESPYIRRWRVDRCYWMGNLNVKSTCIQRRKIDLYRGETSTWNRRIFDVDESTRVIDREILTLIRRLKNVPGPHSYF